MPLSEKNQQTERCYWQVRHGVLTLAMLFLSVAIVNWGLQYKRSLYNTVSTNTSVAKLWTGSKDAKVATHAIFELQPQPSILIASIFLTLLTLFFVLRDYRLLSVFLHWWRATASWTLRLASFQTIFFLRPPPITA